MIEEEINFDKKKVRKNYGNKYLLNRKTISAKDTLFKRLESIQRSKKFNTKNELLEYLVELEDMYHPELETTFKCKKCNESVRTFPGMNLDRLLHRDLCNNSKCNGSIISTQKIKPEKEINKIKCVNCGHSLLQTFDKLICQNCNKEFKLEEIDEPMPDELPPPKPLVFK